MVRTIVSWLLALSVLTFGVFVLYRQLPCRQPVPYSIGVVDPRFGVTREEFRAAVRQAARLWEDAEPRRLFRDAGTGGMVVDAVYDGRQQARDRLEEIGIRLDEGKKSYDALRDRYDASRGVYDSLMAESTALRSSYDGKRAAYEADVRASRNRGLSSDDAARLEAQRAGVNALVDRLNAKLKEAAYAAEDVNALVPLLQQLARQENQSIREYGRVGEAIGGEFEAGIYALAWGKKRITLSSFSGTPELIRLLAHELGHAIGLPHIEDPAAVMHRLNQPGPAALSPADVVLVRERCSLHPGVWLMIKDRFAGAGGATP